MSDLSRRAVLRGLWNSSALVGASFGMIPVAAFAQDAEAARADGGVLDLHIRHLRPQGDRFLVAVALPDQTDRPVLGAQHAPAHATLRALVDAGRAAGNHGDLYENRDRGHSRLSAEAHPQLTHLRYDAELRGRNFDYGPAGPVVFDRPVLANSSTALTAGPFWRSLPRLLLTSAEGPRWLYQNYLASQIHVYPCHRDHDRATGDLFPANTPFFVISQGSSRSDQPHLEALAMILAALRPETKAFLHARALLGPTVQAIFRQGCTPVTRPALYYTGMAHPSVFARDVIDLPAMIAHAQALTPETVPPLVGVQVVSEDIAREGIDHFGQGLSERLFDTPVAIARVWRSAAGQREMVVAAEAAGDVPGRGAALDWHMLRGDRTRVRITPLDARGSRARIVLDWQAPMPVPGNARIRSNRIDIGVFVRPQGGAGGLIGMPGVISILLPQHETRRYSVGPDGAFRIESRDFRQPSEGLADPMIFPRAQWRDDYLYDAAGTWLGWERDSPAGRQRFDTQGRLLQAGGAIPVAHAVIAGADGVPEVQMRPADPILAR